jgi:hypothetical protein
VCLQIGTAIYILITITPFPAFPERGRSQLRKKQRNHPFPPGGNKKGGRNKIKELKYDDIELVIW